MVHELVFLRLPAGLEVEVLEQNMERQCYFVAYCVWRFCEHNLKDLG